MKVATLLDILFGPDLAVHGGIPLWTFRATDGPQVPIMIRAELARILTVHDRATKIKTTHMHAPCQQWRVKGVVSVKLFFYLTTPPPPGRSISTCEHAKRSNSFALAPLQARTHARNAYRFWSRHGVGLRSRFFTRAEQRAEIMTTVDEDTADTLERAYHALVRLGGQGMRRADKIAGDMLALIDALEAVGWSDEDVPSPDVHGLAPAMDSLAKAQ